MTAPKSYSSSPRVCQHLGVQLVLAPLGRGHVAEVLVDPVGPQPGHDAAVPPRRRLHLLAPRLGGVPVVADVVVVEDHRARHRRQQPPVGGVGPGQAVEVGVLLVVAQLGPRRCLDVAARLDEGPHLVGRLVGVDLVAEEEHEVRERARGQVRVVRVRRLDLVGRAQRPRAQGVDTVGLVALRVVGDRGAARAEGEPQGAAGLEGGDDRRGERRGGLGPDLLAVDRHRVGLGGAGLEVVELDEGVVVTVDEEGPGARGGVAPGHRDGAPVTGLDPHRRGRLVDVAQEGSEQQGAVVVAHGCSSTFVARRSSIAR